MTRQVLPDGHPSVPGPRSLGSRPGQACSGSDPRLSDPRATVLVNGTEVGLRRNINLVESGSVTLSGTDDPDTDTVEVTIDSTGGGGTNNIRVSDTTGGVTTVRSTQPEINFISQGYANVSVANDLANSRANITVGVFLTAANEAIGGTSLAANKLPYYSSGSTASTTDLTAFARTLLDDVNAAAARTTLGIVNQTGSQEVTTIDFGSFPGRSDASLDITGQTGIDTSSVVNAWLQPADTDDHTADEHRLETISVMAGNVIPGVGFTIYATNNSQRNEPLGKPGIDTFRAVAAPVYGYSGESVGGRGTLICGKWSVAWKWS